MGHVVNGFVLSPIVIFGDAACKENLDIYDRIPTKSLLQIPVVHVLNRASALLCSIPLTSVAFLLFTIF